MDVYRVLRPTEIRDSVAVFLDVKKHRELDYQNTEYKKKNREHESLRVEGRRVKASLERGGLPGDLYFSNKFDDNFKWPLNLKDAEECREVAQLMLGKHRLHLELKAKKYGGRLQNRQGLNEKFDLAQEVSKLMTVLRKKYAHGNVQAVRIRQPCTSGKTDR